MNSGRTCRSEINEFHSSEIQCSPDIQNILQLFLVVCSSSIFASPVFLLTTGKDEEEGAKKLANHQVFSHLHHQHYDDYDDNDDGDDDDDDDEEKEACYHTRIFLLVLKFLW